MYLGDIEIIVLFLDGDFHTVLGRAAGAHNIVGAHGRKVQLGQGVVEAEVHVGADAGFLHVDVGETVGHGIGAAGYVVPDGAVGGAPYQVDVLPTRYR